MVSERNGYLKLSDLGFTKRIVDSRTFTMCGTPDYMVRISTRHVLIISMAPVEHPACTVSTMRSTAGCGSDT
jgi:hypothetical protein